MPSSSPGGFLATNGTTSSYYHLTQPRRYKTPQTYTHTIIHPSHTRAQTYTRHIHPTYTCTHSTQTYTLHTHAHTMTQTYTLHTHAHSTHTPYIHMHTLDTQTYIHPTYTHTQDTDVRTQTYIHPPHSHTHLRHRHTHTLRHTLLPPPYTLT